MFHAWLYISATCFYNILYHFGMIYETNLLTRCPVLVPVFCYLFFQKSCSGKFLGISWKFTWFIFMKKQRRSQEGSCRGPHRPQTPPRRGQGVGYAWGASGPCGAPLHASSWLCPCFLVKITHVNFQLIPRNFPEQLFWNKKTAENRNWHWASC